MAMMRDMAKIEEKNCDERTRAGARELYEVYIANSDGLNYQGLPCPTWDDLPEEVRAHWCAVADWVLNSEGQFRREAPCCGPCCS